MALAYIIDGGLHDRPGLGTDLYETYPAVQKVYRQVAGWTGVPVDRLLSWGPDPFAEYREVGALRRAAVVIGLGDVLADLGVRPAAVAGMSLGAMTGAALAGAVSRQELFELLSSLREVPLSFEPPQGMGKLLVPAGVDPAEFVGGFPPGAWIAVDVGLVDGGRRRLVQVSGHREALLRLADQVPEKDAFSLPEESVIAFHSPLREYVREAMEPQIATMTFKDPETPLCGGMEPGRYATADLVREMFRKNQTDALSLPRMFGCLDDLDVELSLLVGPGTADLYRNAAEHTVIHVECPEHLTAALAAVQELGLLPARY
jgi:[acyl-carrier-protein] S-malonyltransferase